MKTITRYLIPAAGLLAALPLLRADEPAGGDKKEMRVIVAPDGPGFHRGFHGLRVGASTEKESVTFLGIDTRPADATLAAQLNLARGSGLIVRDVVADSPAATVLKVDDVLVKLDDQLLIEQRQLSVLVRNHHEGDEVTLTYVRNGKEGTAKVKLAKHDVPKLAMIDAFPGVGNFNMAFGDEAGVAGMGREDMDRVLALIDQGNPDHVMRRIHIDRDDAPGLRNISVSVDNSNMVFSDDKGSLDLTIKDGKKTLVAKNAKGEPLFSGPVTTPEERKALPADVRARLDKLEGMQEFSFQTDDDFQGSKVQVVKPAKTKIALPPRPLNPPPPGSPAF